MNWKNFLKPTNKKMAISTFLFIIGLTLSFMPMNYSSFGYIILTFFFGPIVAIFAAISQIFMFSKDFNLFIFIIFGFLWDYFLACTLLNVRLKSNK